METIVDFIVRVQLLTGAFLDARHEQRAQGYYTNWLAVPGSFITMWRLIRRMYPCPLQDDELTARLWIALIGAGLANLIVLITRALDGQPMDWPAWLLFFPMGTLFHYVITAPIVIERQKARNRT